MRFLWDLPSDKLRYLLNMAIEIVSFPINSMVDLSHQFVVCLPGRVHG